VLHLIADHIEDRTHDIDRLSEARLPLPYLPSDGPRHAAPNRGEPRDLPQPRHRHPRNVRVIPRSRDFH
jgi:error-prone DNA polymerase